MQWTITITGNREEMNEALKAAREIMGGQPTVSGEGAATYALSQPVTAPQQEQPKQQAYTPAAQPTQQQAQYPQGVPTQQPYQPPQQYQQQTFPQPDQQQAPAQQQQAPTQAPQGAVPTSASQYTLEQLAVAATQLMDAGRQQELVNMLNQSFGVQALTQLPKEQYGAFATKLREMGAKI